jgi:hypothetical protein
MLTAVSMTASRLPRKMSKHLHPTARSHVVIRLPQFRHCA